MNEKEKMLKGKLYNPLLDGLREDRVFAKKLCFQYNSLSPDKINEKNKIISRLIKTNGEFIIEPSFWCDYGYNIEIGNNFYSNHNLVILDCAKVSFGDNVFIGPNCSFYTPSHPLDSKTRNSGLEYAKEIKIGNNVWFGGNVVVLGGVTIGNNVVAGAGSVINRSIEDNCIVCGNPAKVIKKTT